MYIDTCIHVSLSPYHLYINRYIDGMAADGYGKHQLGPAAGAPEDPKDGCRGHHLAAFAYTYTCIPIHVYQYM